MTDLNEIFIPESDYPAEMKSRVLPYINARRSDGYFDGYDGKSLHYVKYALHAERSEAESDGNNFARIYRIGGKMARNGVLSSQRRL